MKNKSFYYHFFDINERLPIYLTQYGYRRFKSKKQMTHLIKDNYVLHIVVSGSGVYETSQGSYTFSKGQAFLLWPGMPVNYGVNANSNCAYIWIGLDGEGVEKFLEKTPFNKKKPVIDLISVNKMTNIIWDMISHKGQNEEKYYLYGKMYEFLQTFLDEIKDKDKIPIDNKDICDRVIRYIKENLNDVNITKICKELYIDRTVLFRQFKKKYGISLQEYIYTYRMSVAQNLITQTDKSFKEIATECGYETYMGFCKRFSHFFGMKPSEYRKYEKKEIGMEQEKTSGILLEFIKESWGKARTTSGERDLDLPYPFVPPAISSKDLYRTLYYWDTYFINIGLIADGHVNWARENVENLLYALHYFGCVPNYTRKDGADFCSQVPLLGLMIQEVYEATGDEIWLEKAVEGLEKEYAFWMKERMTSIGLNQYGCNATDKDVLLYYYDYISSRIEMDQSLSDKEKMRVARNFLAEAESGESYTPRYENHNALDYVQIDLNAHLYGVEEFLSAYFSDKDKEKANYYKDRREQRLYLIEKYCFNEKTGMYCDYNFVSKKKNDIVCAACFLPYFYGFAHRDGNISHIYEILKCKGGVVACQDTGEYIYQWGYPYIWAPYQYFAYEALVRYGLEKKAEELRVNYMQLLSSVYDRTGVLWERYDENGPAEDLEYPTQQILGWTAGVYRHFVAQSKEDKM